MKRPLAVMPPPTSTMPPDPVPPPLTQPPPPEMVSDRQPTIPREVPPDMAAAERAAADRLAAEQAAAEESARHQLEAGFEAAVHHLPSAFPEGPPNLQMTERVKPIPHKKKMAPGLLAALMFGVTGIVVGVGLVIYFVWVASPREPVKSVSIVTVEDDSIAAGVDEEVADEGAGDLAFEPTEVIRSPEEEREARRGTRRNGAKRKSASKSGLTAEQRRLIALYKGGGDERVVQSNSRRDQTNKATRDISSSELSSVYRKNRRTLQACYTRALKRDNSLTDFKAEVEIVVGASGVVKNVKLKTANRDLTECIKTNIRRWVFQPVGHTATVAFPLIFAGS